jgi:uncharacterized RDD family membrane protein YckC
MKGVSHGKRFLALVVDLAVVEFIITRPLNKILNENFSGDFSLSSIGDLVAGSSKLILISTIIGLLSVLYWAILEYKIGQTFGALLFRLRAKSEMGSLSFGRAFLRNLSKLNMLLLVIDSINIFFTDRRQRFLEVFSKTSTLEGK